jgi:hypothetical protein
MYEMSLIELESELAAELPTRSLMSRRKMKYGFHPHSSAHANNGSVANANSTNQVIFNPQIAIITGVNNGGAGLQANGALIAQAGLDSNTNGNTQFGVPVNFQG